MSRRIGRLVGLAFVLLLPLSTAYGIPSVELDLDGTVGNGPDTVSVNPGDPVSIDVWITGIGEPLVFFNVHVCNPGGELAFQSGSYSVPAAWYTEPLVETASCVEMAAWDPDFITVMPIPRLVGDLVYQVSQPGTTADLTFGYAVFEDQSFMGGTFQATIGATVLIGGPTPVESPSWSSIKQLFR